MHPTIKIWFNRYLGDEEALLLAIIILASGLLLWILGGILTPFLASIVIAYLLQGAVNRLMQLGLTRSVSAILTYLLFLGMLSGTAIFVIPLVVAQASSVINDLPAILNRGEQAIKSLVESGSNYIGEDLLSSAFAQLNQVVVENGEKFLAYSLGQIPGLLTLMVYGVLVIILVFFLLKDWHILGDGLKDFLPLRRGAMRAIWSEMDEQVSNYLRGKAIEILIVGMASFIVFSLFGLRYSLLLSILVGFSVLIPFIGAFSVTIPVALVAIFQWGLEPTTFYLISAYIVLQILDGNMLVPLIFSEAVNLHPAYIILAIILFGGMWGLWGVFFAIPLATFIKALVTAWPVSDDSLQGD